ncbi:hypothetical protein AVEN_80695-1, partial [Araneus ventricosus]
YRCGDGRLFSKVFDFRTLRKGTEWRPRVLIFGDLGYKDGASTPYLIEEAKNGTVDLILHNAESNNCNSGFPILLKLELLPVEKFKAFVFEWIAFSNFTYNVKDLSSKVSGLSSFECKELDSGSSLSQKSLVMIILAC